MAVYTVVSDDALAAFLTQYDIGEPVKKTPISEGVENTNYGIDTDRGRFILTLFEKRVRRDDLPFFMAFTEHLAKEGLPAPAPILRRDGAIIGELCERPAVIIEFLQGRPIMTPDENACAEMGRMLAKLHHASENFTGARENPWSVEGWRGLAAACDAADSIEKGFSSFIAEEFAALERDWPSKLPSAVVHADLFPDNVFFDDGAISGVIDFYFACTDSYAYDLGICLNAWCFDADGAYNEANARAMVRAYLDNRSLSADEIAAMPILLRGSGLRFLLTRTYDWLNQSDGALVTVKDPRPFKRIIEFHRTAASPSHYGF